MAAALGSLGAVYIGEPDNWVEIGHMTTKVGFEMTRIDTLRTVGTDEPVRTLTNATLSFGFEVAEVSSEALAAICGDYLWARIWFERDGGDPIELGYIEYAYDLDPQEIADAITEGLREVYE